MAMQSVRGELSDERFSYLTFYHYFKAIEIAFAVHNINTSDSLIAAMKQKNPSIVRKNKMSEENKNRLRQSLFHSWNSQLHLHQYQVMEDEFIGLSVQWLPTMFYYTLYHSLQAYFAASGKPHTPTHAEALRVITGEAKRFPAFMGAVCTSYFPKPGYLHIDLGKSNSNEISNLTRPNNENLNLHLAKLLKTTRAHVLEDSFIEKRKRLKRKRLLQNHKDDCDKASGHTGIFHFLYRMRKRFNYEDGEISHQSESGDASPREMYQAIRKGYLGYSYCLEWLAAAYAGKNNFEQLFGDFQKQMRNKLAAEAIAKMETRFKQYF